MTEQRLGCDILSNKLQLDALLAVAYLGSGTEKGVEIGHDMAKMANNDYKYYGKYKFPSWFENAKIEQLGKSKTERLSKEEVAEMITLHKKLVEDYSAKKLATGKP